jgi:hypothetical protein
VSYPTALAIAVTVLSAVSGIGFLALLVRPRDGGPDGGQDRIAAGLHVLMAYAMIAMPWSWGALAAPPLAQIIVFGLATAYFVVLLLLPRPAGDVPSGGRLPRDRSPHAHGVRVDPLLAAYHAVMMAAMVAMAAMMLDMPTSGAGHDAGSMNGMPGMSDMPGMSGGSAGDATGTSAASGTDTLIAWTAIVLLALGAVWMLVRIIRTQRTDTDATDAGHTDTGRTDSRRWDRLTDASLLVMSVGMLLAFLPF